MSIPPEPPPKRPDPPARRRPARDLAELASRLSDSQDAPAEAAIPPHAASGAEAGTPANTPDALPETMPLKARRERGRAALDALFSEQPQKPSQALAETAPAPTGEAMAANELETGGQAVRIPAEIEPYLPAETWRKINSPMPRRGVLINALERLRSIQYLLSTYLPSHLVQEKIRRPVPGLVNGQMLQGSLLFSDVSGFTAMSERLAGLGPEGAERLTQTMNGYFSAMLEILSWSGGILVKFAGDATLVYFPEQEGGLQARWAVRAGFRMLRAMRQFENLETPGGLVSLRMKIGVASGEFLAASIGSASRMEYGLLGSAVTRTLGAEAASGGPGQLIVDLETMNLLAGGFNFSPQAPGYFLVQQATSDLDDFEIRAEQRRARGTIAWSASPQAIVAQMQVTLRQIQALSPYLAPELAVRVIAHAQHRNVQSEFRPTVVMFVNFTGPENLLETWGPGGATRVTSILGAYFNTMQEVIARYGGIISRIDPYSQGTKMLVLFGAPVSHEDDPQRAVSAALAMNLELDALNERLRQKFMRFLPEGWSSPLLQHRIGITYGVTFAGQVGSSTRREYTVMGDDVNLAARLMSAGKTGQILVNEAVWEAVGDLFIFTPLPAIRVKGKSKPIAISQVDGLRERTLEARILARTPLIGRDVELKRARQALERALHGRPGLLTLQGPPGIGKSHLADTLLKQAVTEGARLLSVQCPSYNAAAPYAAWGNLLRGLAGITVLDLPQVIPDKLARFTSSLMIETDLNQSLGALMGLAPIKKPVQSGETTQMQAASTADADFRAYLRESPARRRSSSLDLLQHLEQNKPAEAGMAWQTLPADFKGQQRRRVYADMVTLLGKLCTSSAVVIFFEDAHWLDAASQDLLRYILNHLEHAPLLILLAQRPGDAKGQLSASGTNTMLELAPLDAQGTHDLVAHIMVSELARLIYEQSGGLPLLVEEISHWIQRTQKISPEDLREVLQGSDMLQKLVLSGLETLPEMQREAARVAAVIGNEFHVGELQAALGDEVDPVSLSSHLRGLVSAQVFRLVQPGVDARYAFQQSLVRDILYNSLPFERRRALHQRLAEYLSAPPEARRAAHSRIVAFLEAGSERAPTQPPELIAFHYERAGAYAPAAWRWLEAAQQARANQDYSAAAALYPRGLESLDHLPAGTVEADLPLLRTQLLLGSADLALQAGDYSTALSGYEKANEHIPAELPLEALVCARVGLALLLPAQGRSEEARCLLEQALAALKQPERQPAPDADLELAVLATLGWLLWRSGSPRAAGIIAEAQELGAHRTGIWAKQVKALLLDLAGDEPAAREAYLGLNLPGGVARLAIRRGDRALGLQQNEQARLDFSEAVELWGKPKPDPNGLFLANYRLAQACWQAGEVQAASIALNAALAQAPALLPSLRAEWQKTARSASKALEGKLRKWPVLSWQALEDAFAINLLFRI